ncbi:MAG: SAM-dependent methyltransferase [Bacteroidetes bacterium GWF2_43_63]|nr:MAG: SAM-dependent methyltransferase [Bacteroidetes bacterium GWE2_42_42]OFY54515.1 MAG: SAM-dependent methyltransferase [Bacteroidetes bacterium GWF2_43_63]HBG70465.1 SAM-dependent methyltransferase [Bacteroidales bacterium]HCB63417.1 SAM-dependent methyltransferase [Bacteroidales bacterium]
MNTKEIVDKLWNLCNTLRDDGITYHQYVSELTYILFLKMAKETGTEDKIPEKYRWDKLVKKEGVELKKFYRQLLLDLGTIGSGKVKQIYTNAQTNIDEPKNLEKIIKNIDALDWYSAKEEGLGNLYEGLLEKNANEKKSGAGQYFTPRPLIEVMVNLMEPKPGELCNDPACGTFGFMVLVDKYLRAKYDDYYADGVDANFQRTKALSGCELVQETHRLALMNAMLHEIDGPIYFADTLSQAGEKLKGYDLVLTNPPFGTKKGGERPTRSDLTFKTSNKQLNFLQHIYRSLKPNGKARAAVVLPDNVLFQDGDGQKVRTDLLNKCNLHTILRLPTGIFYAQGVKTNVLFFTRGEKDTNNTKKVWYYDLRTNMESFGKRNQLSAEDFTDFVKLYKAKDRSKIKDERWSVYSREDIKIKGDNLDLGLIEDNNVLKSQNISSPEVLLQSASENLKAILKDIELIAKELK